MVEGVHSSHASLAAIQDVFRQLGESVAQGQGDNTFGQESRSPQKRRFYRTRLCPFHFKKGSVCKEGENCSYAHSFLQLRPSVDL